MTRKQTTFVISDHHPDYDHKLHVNQNKCFHKHTTYQCFVYLTYDYSIFHLHYPSPTSSDIITTKPATAPQEASLPFPLKGKKDTMIKLNAESQCKKKSQLKIYDGIIYIFFGIIKPWLFLTNS